MNRTIFDDLDSWGNYSEISHRTSDYHQKVKDGVILPINPYYWYRVDGLSPRSETYNGLRSERDVSGATAFNTFVNQGFHQEFFSPEKNFFSSKEELIGRTTNKLLNRARNVEIDLGIALGEYRETADFIVSAMSKTAKGIGAIRKGDFSGALRILRGNTSDLRGVRRKDKLPFRKKDPGLADVADAAADTQLALQFGLTPIVNDVADALVILDQGLKNQKSKVHTIRASTSSDYDSDIGLVDSSNGPINVYSASIHGSAKCSGKIEYVVDNPITATLSSVGFINPISVAWELVPLSFVVDWFMPVGDYLLNVFPPPGLKALRGYTYYKCKGTSFRSTSLGNGWDTHYSTEDNQKERRVLNDFPDYYLNIPDLSLTKGKVMSGIALLWNALA